MTQKHFEAVAKVIADAVDRGADFERFVVVKIACEMANIFMEANPRFNRDKFYRACHLGHLAAN